MQPQSPALPGNKHPPPGLPPTPGPETARRALRALIQARQPLAALQVFHDELGDVFRIQLPAFSPIVLVGPQAARFVLVEAREGLNWRNPADPVTRLLRHGVLVEDGDTHDRLRRLMNPSLHKRMLDGYLQAMWDRSHQVASRWTPGREVDMLVEMRRIALLILMDTLYRIDFSDQVDRLWKAVIGSIRFISPGLWLLWRGAPRPQYRRAIRRMDDYLFRIIRHRRATLPAHQDDPPDLLSALIQAGLDDDLVRDQLLTMLIAGHDTSTALLAWTLYLLGSHPTVLARAQEEVRSVVGDAPPGPEELRQLPLLTRVIKESLRLYPPIHLGSRLAARDLEYEGYRIPAGERVIYSIYLTQRHKEYWPDPHRFDPDRHLPGERPAPYTWLPFGGGPRNCIGAAFGQVEAQVILAYVLQHYDLTLGPTPIRPHMGATLEPHPGVPMKVQAVSKTKIL
jgi:cytochrome P450